MVIDIHFHPLVHDAEYLPDLSTAMERFFRLCDRSADAHDRVSAVKFDHA